MATTSSSNTGNTSSSSSSSGGSGRANNTSSSGVSASNKERSTAPTESEDEKLEREEAERREASLKYAKKVSDNGEEPLSIESDADQESASWLVANGYADIHAVQEGIETYNYILLTEEGKSALSTYNEEKE